MVDLNELWDEPTKTIENKGFDLHVSEPSCDLSQYEFQQTKKSNEKSKKKKKSNKAANMMINKMTKM